MDPGDIYTQRLAERRATAAEARRREDRAANARLVTALLGFVVLWWVWRNDAQLAWMLIPIGMFYAAVEWHGRAQRTRERAERAARFYEHGLARLAYDFAAVPAAGAFAPPEHPYAVHLDLFGRGSLFAFLSNALTASGRRALAEWLLAPAAPEEIVARQEAVAELSPRINLREEIATLAPETVEAFDSDALPAWGEAPAEGDLRVGRGLAFAASVVVPVAAVAVALGAPGLTLLAALVFAGGVGVRYAKRIEAIVKGVQAASKNLPQVIVLLERIETEPFAAERLRRVRERLDTGGRSPSAVLRGLQRRLDALEWRYNMMFAVPAVLLLWGTQWGLAIEAWRRQWGGRLRAWLDALGEVEALLDLGSYSFEHPADVFPEFITDHEGPLFDATGIAHPLLPETEAVRNDLRLDAGGPLTVITGSNMSGKSTLLRTVGVNAILAQAGAPVRARALRLTPLQAAASLRALDSLQGGASSFYAEITCMRRMVELTEGALPVLVLLDELLHGTNSHDRRIGASGFVRGLLERGALGLITTHDLALAELEKEHAPRVRNAHFDCTLRDGKLAFDHQLKPGVVKTSNALELMRAVGLDV